MKYKIILTLLLAIFFGNGYAQSSHFGKKRIVSIHSSYLPDWLEGAKSSIYIPTNINFLFSISEHFYTGLYYGRFSQRIDNFITSSHEVFHKGGLLLRYKEAFLNDNAAINMDVSLGYSNYSLNPNDGNDFISHKNYQMGINCLFDFRIYKPLFISAGFIGHRTLKKGDYGFEVFPMLGLNVQF
ncbi:MAG TPA: hypothetical protein PKD51_05790 [Saprospiraceae bacterium]|nr:hypothetical protein [Saprospiraceae bacterium]